MKTPIKKEKEKKPRECEICNGNPPIKNFDTGPHIGKCCETCYKILSWKKKQ